MIRLYAAGSLKGALADVAKAYETAGGDKVETTFGPSGLLKDEIAGGTEADVFASANMEHPRALHDAKVSSPVTRFARNRLCALVRPGLAADSENLIERMLEPQVKLGTSTPKADPSGDYALEVFARADAIRPGARNALAAKALQLTGRKDSPAPPAGNVYGWHIAEGRADIFLTYRTNALAAQQHYPGQQMVELPETLAVAADYGLTVINGASVTAQAFADFILSPKGQNILAGYGFSPA
jgi:ABC-type molybdate transport system substrate-binding protein